MASVAYMNSPSFIVSANSSYSWRPWAVVDTANQNCEYNCE